MRVGLVVAVLVAAWWWLTPLTVEGVDCGRAARPTAGRTVEAICGETVDRQRTIALRWSTLAAGLAVVVVVRRRREPSQNPSHEPGPNPT